jgi:hypothetical protein
VRVLGVPERLGVDGRVPGLVEGSDLVLAPVRGVGFTRADGRLGVCGEGEASVDDRGAGLTMVASGAPRVVEGVARPPEEDGGVRTGSRGVDVGRRCRVGLLFG